MKRKVNVSFLLVLLISPLSLKQALYNGYPAAAKSITGDVLWQYYHPSHICHRIAMILIVTIFDWYNFGMVDEWIINKEQIRKFLKARYTDLKKTVYNAAIKEVEVFSWKYVVLS